MSPEWRKINLLCSLEGDRVVLSRKPIPAMRQDLLAMFDRDELKKYMTDDELTGLPESAESAEENH
jgi:succinate dehydrogenase / fumarate reductase flavoprotein subunit